MNRAELGCRRRLAGCRPCQAHGDDRAHNRQSHATPPKQPQFYSVHDHLAHEIAPPSVCYIFSMAVPKAFASTRMRALDEAIRAIPASWFKPAARVYWTDLTVSAAVGWT